MTPRTGCSLMVWGLLALTLAGCATTRPQSSRLRIGDLITANEEVAQGLAGSDFLRDRGPDSPRIVVTIDKVENLTTDLIPPAEQWMMVSRLQASLPVQTMAKQKNIRFQVPPEREPLLREADQAVRDVLIPKDPTPATHLMTATFRASPRVAENKDGLADQRSDYYYLEYQITDLATRQIVWTGKYEFQRQASGLLID